MLFTALVSKSRATLSCLLRFEHERKKSDSNGTVMRKSLGIVFIAVVVLGHIASLIIAQTIAADAIIPVGGVIDTIIFMLIQRMSDDLHKILKFYWPSFYARSPINSRTWPMTVFSITIDRKAITIWFT